MTRHLADLYRYRALIGTLVLRELRARYRGSFLGFLWSFLNPLLLMLVYALVFSIYLRVPMEGYAVFLFSGLLPWLWFSSSLAHASGVIVASGALVKRILFPAEVLPLVSVLANLINMLLSLPLLLVFLLAFGIRLHGVLLFLPLLLVLQLLLTTGLALALSALNVHLRDVEQILTNGLTLLFFLTPILYPGIHRADDDPPRRVADRAAAAPLLPEPDRGAGPELPEHLLLRPRAALDPPRYRDHLRGARAGRGLVGVRSPPRQPGRGDLTVSATPDAAEIAISLRDVSKRFRLYRGRQVSTVKDLFVRLFVGSSGAGLFSGEELWALHDVSLDLGRGRMVGIVGSNGSGKSTLLKVLGGILKPTTGQVSVRGRVSALIELGAGFHPEFTGRENIYINGVLLGLTRAEIRARFDEIVAFAGLEPFIDSPVKTYSSGMYMRLGFAIAVTVDPDILLIDEVLAVGDEAFQHRCVGKIQEFKARGKTIVLVSHDLGSIERLCDEAVWLDAGRLQVHGETREVVGRYLDHVAREEARALGVEHDRAEAIARTGTAARWGSREVELTRVQLAGGDGRRAIPLRDG